MDFGPLPTHRLRPGRSQTPANVLEDSHPTMPSRHPYQLGDEPVPGYRLVKFLGRGGFGEVWKASAPGGAAVALKIIVNLSGSEGRKELRALSIVRRIQHAHLVPVTAVWLKDGEGNILNDDFAVEEERILNTPRQTATTAANDTMVVPFTHSESRSAELIIAMGLGHKSLFDRLQECRQQDPSAGIPPAELLDYMEQSARAIDYLNSASHQLGKSMVAVQHCDIKPHNILIVGNAVQVCDFGLARVRGDVRATASTGASVAYASPEVLEAEGRPSEATDQYSLAVTYFELRTGTLPYRETSFAKVMQAVLVGDLDLSKLPAAEQAVIRRATSRDPKQRHPSAMEMVKKLRRAVEAPEPEPTKTRVAPLLILATLLLIGIAGAAIWYERDRLSALLFPEKKVTKSEPLHQEEAAETNDVATTGGDVTEGSSEKPPVESTPEPSATERAQALNARALERLNQKKYSDALADFEAAIELDSAAVDPADVSKAYLARGRLRLTEKLFEDAESDFSAVIERTPDQARDAYLGRAQCRLASGNTEGASTDLAALLEANPEDVDALFFRGRLRLADQQLAEATSDFNRVAELSPEFFQDPQRAKPAAQACYDQGKQLLVAKDYAGALSQFDRAALIDTDGSLGFKSHADFVAAYSQRANEQRLAKKFEEAIADCTKAIEDHPKFAAPAYLERGECYADQEMFAKADDDLSKSIELDSQNYLAYSARGWVRLQSEAFDDALQDLDRAIQLKRTYRDRFYRGVALSAQGKHDEAIQAFGELISESPQKTDPLYQRALVWLDLKDYDQAQTDLDAVVKILEPVVAADRSRDALLANPIALLSWVRACRPGGSKLSFEEMQAAKNACMYSDWKTPWHIDALAAAYANQGDFDKASKWQKDALDKSSPDAPLPPLAPSRRELLRLYRGQQAFHLPEPTDSQRNRLPEAEAGTKPESGLPAVNSKESNAKTGSSPPVNSQGGRREKKPATPEQIDKEATERLKNLTPKPPPE